MTIIFDGCQFTAGKEKFLKREVKKLLDRSIHPKLVSIIVGDDPASKLYVNLKMKAAERIGIELIISKWESDVNYGNLIEEIRNLNKDKNVHGIMVQLPLPLKIRHHTLDIINSIQSNKDVDGLRKNSIYVHPTAKAVLQIIKFAGSQCTVHPATVCVVGATGMVGTLLVGELRKKGYKVIGCNSKTKDLKSETLKVDILVSATGSPGIIGVDMVKEGAVVIDVGSPQGDVDSSTGIKASFITPVPGGVGPVTISCLLENLIKASGSYDYSVRGGSY